MRRRRSLLRRLRREESGFTLIELITVLGMLVIVMTCLSYAMVAAHKAEEDMNRRFGSQINARIALDQLRREIHCATAVTPAPIGTTSNITIVLGPRCPTASAGLTVTWCTSGSGTRYALYRQTGLYCGTSGRKVVDYLTTGAVFSYTLQLPTSLAYVSVTLPVNTKPASGRPDYRLTDDIVLRNSVRA
jgi:prepilin-type N-terminal cleavage/methylation domain-containing protein